MGAAFGLLGSLFVAGETLVDPGGWEAVAFLGLRRPGTAGALLVVMAAVPVVASAVAAAVLDADRPDPAGVLGGSSTAAAIPTLVVGVLFLLSYAAERGQTRPDGHRSDVSDLGPARTGR